MKKILSILMIVILLNFASVNALESLQKPVNEQENLPDLAVKSINIHNNSNEATIKIKVKNYGRARVEGFWYYINYGDSFGEFLYYEGTIRPRQTQIITLTHNYGNAGSYNAMINIDPIYMIQESNEENNIQEFNVEIEEQLADLAVERINVRERDNEATIKIKVKNYGNQDVEGFWYYINYGDSYGQFLYYEGTIKAGKSKMITLNHEYASQGNYNGMVNLDPVYMVPEQNEENNIKDFFVGLNSKITSNINALSQ